MWKRDLTLTAPFSDRSSNVKSANKPDKYFSFFLSFFFPFFFFFFLGGGGGGGWGGGGGGGFEGAEDSLASHLGEIENHIITS